MTEAPRCEEVYKGDPDFQCEYEAGHKTKDHYAYNYDLDLPYKWPVTTNPWIMHEHLYEPCGCGVIASIYSDIPGDRYANGTDHITVLRCAQHPSTGHKVDHVENAEPEEDLDWEESSRWFGWFRR